MTTLTLRMIDRVEWLKAEYAKLIESGTGDNIDWMQWRRMNTLLGYLEERLGR